jgi:hypothetical protein
VGLPSITLPDGSPSPAALFLGTLLTSALYHQDREAAQVAAQVTNTRLAAFVANPGTVPPDYCILVDDTLLTAFIVFAGTTNTAQWIGHSAGALVPFPDLATGYFSLASAIDGINAVQPAIEAAANPVVNRHFQVFGHSYGAAAGFLLLLHWNNKYIPLSTDLLTIGEPKSLTGGYTAYMPDTHNRVWSWNGYQHDLETFDPVPLMPPGELQYAGLGKVIALLKITAKLKYTHYGQIYKLRESSLDGPIPQNLVHDLPLANLAEALNQSATAAYLHLVDTTYLPRAVTLLQQYGYPSFAPLLPFAQKYCGSPAVLPDVLTPLTTPAQIDQGFGQPAGTTTDSNRNQFATVVSAAAVIPNVSTGVLTMPSYPTWKGTYFFLQDGEGTSESYFADVNVPNPISTYSAMLLAMQALAPYRLNLSRTIWGSPKTTNGLSIIAIRIENVNVNRDAVTVPVSIAAAGAIIPPNSVSITPAGYTDVQAQFNLGDFYYENDDADAAWKVGFNDGLGHNAIQYFHGVPEGSKIQPNQQNNPPFQLGQRLTAPNPQWLTNLYQFTNQMRTQNLGLRYSTLQWTPNGNPVNGVAATGNGTPLAVQYNAAATGTDAINTYSFQIAQLPTVPPNPNPSAGKFRFILRGFKPPFNVLNGRYPCNVYTKTPSGGPTQYWLNVLKRAANYTPFNGQGYVSPEIWTTLTPAQCPTGSGALTSAPGAGGVILTSKKTGRPFELQRGRASRRAS